MPARLFPALVDGNDDTNHLNHHGLQLLRMLEPLHPMELNLVAAGSQWLGYLLTSDTVNTWLAPFRSVEVAPDEPASPWP